MNCVICGDKQAWYRHEKFQTLCGSCCRDTPDKVDRQTFDVEYWGHDFLSVPTITRKEFYTDYLASRLTVREYKASTTTRECPMCGLKHNDTQSELCAPCVTYLNECSDQSDHHDYTDHIGVN